MQETLYRTLDAGVSPSDSYCRSFSIRQHMQETLYQTADTGDCIRQRMQETLYKTADAQDFLLDSDAGVSQSDSGSWKLSIRQRIKETLY